MFDISLVKSTYDDLANKVKSDLDEQFNRGRIKGTDYANVYANLMNEILQLAFQAPIQAKDIELKDHQQQLIDAQTKNQMEDLKVKAEQEKLLDAQTQDQLESVNLKKEQEKLYQKQEALTQAQTDVAIRQKQSYDDSIRLKLFKAQMDTWGIMFSSGMLEDKPSVIKNDEVSSLYTDIKNHIR